MYKNIRSISALVVVAACILGPSAAHAQTSGFSSEGIFSCDGAESYGLSAGVSAGSGTFVPVNDQAVTINTNYTVRNLGYLVYKECILRNTVNRMSESAGLALVRRQLQSYNAGNDGKPFFVKDFVQDQVENSDEALYHTLITNDELKTLNPLYRDTIKRAIVRTYQEQTRAANSKLACPYKGDLQNLLSGDPEGSIWEGLAALQNPMCNPLFAYINAKSYTDRNVATAQDEWRTRLTWGQGTYDRTVVDQKNGKRTTVTPASIINALTQQAVTSGFRKTENANDIGQMVSALFAGMGAQILSDTQGLSGLTQSDGGQSQDGGVRQSYLDQAVQQTSKTLVDNAVNTTSQILKNALRVEQQFNQIFLAIGTNLTQTITQIRGIENTCWNLIIQKVCSSPVSFTSNPPTCTAVGGGTLRIATSTAISQAVINAQITPLSSSTVEVIKSSNNAIELIQELTLGVSNTTSQGAQSVAMQQLDSLVARRVLHTQNDVTSASQQQASVRDNMGTLIETITTTWGDGTPTPANPYNADSGWCNVNDPNTLSMWKAAWK
jgi:hypothetical protein